jgi:hypothetical protein
MVMTQGHEPDYKGYSAIPLAMLIGFIVSIIVYLLLFAIILLWSLTFGAKFGKYYLYSVPVFESLNISGLLVFLTFSVLTGICAYYFLYRSTQQLKIIVLALCVCGLVYGFGFEYYLYLWDYLFYTYYPVFEIGQPFVFGIIAILLVPATGIVAWKLCSPSQQPEKVKRRISLTILALVLVLILTIAIPLGYASGAKGSPIYDLLDCDQFDVNVDIFSGNNITRIEAYGSGMGCLVQETPFFITYNGVDISNQTAIGRSGLNLLISPPDGLEAELGSVVYISGGDLHLDGHIEVGVHKITGESYVVNSIIVR